MPKMKIFSKLLKLIKEGNSFLLVSHMNPDGDAIGASIALAMGLKQMGKKGICVLNCNTVPENLIFLPGAKTVRQAPPKKRFDVVILLDCNDPGRTGFKEFNAEKTAIIDHHVMSEEVDAFYKTTDACLIDTGAASAGLLVYRVLNALKVTIDKKIATNLYTSIHVDTGGFRYSNTSPEALMAAAKLLEAGASPWDISKEVYENIPYKSIKLLGLSLATVEQKDGISWITTTKDMFDMTGTSAEDSEDFVDFPRKVRNSEVAVFFREDSKNVYKLSLRSKGRVDVQAVAAKFGGGGHKAAAGCRLEGTLKQVQQKVFDALKSVI